MAGVRDHVLGVLGIVAVIQISKTANLLIGRCCVRLAGRRSHYRRVSRTVESKTVPLNLGGKVMWSVEPSESNHMPQLQLAFRFRPILLKKVPALGAARPDLAAQIVAACWAQRYSAPKQLLPERSA